MHFVSIETNLKRPQAKRCVCVQKTSDCGCVGQWRVRKSFLMCYEDEVSSLGRSDPCGLDNILAGICAV